MMLACKIRALVASLHFNQVPARVTVSLGIAQIGPTLTLKTRSRPPTRL